MSHWVLNCPECKQEFTYTEIAEGSGIGGLEERLTGGPYKPDFPPGGLKMECPNCKTTSTFQRYQLLYRHS
jgi:phage FluMu protein Com